MVGGAGGSGTCRPSAVAEILDRGIGDMVTRVTCVPYPSKRREGVLWRMWGTMAPHSSHGGEGGNIPPTDHRRAPWVVLLGPALLHRARHQRHRDTSDVARGKAVAVARQRAPGLRPICLAHRHRMCSRPLGRKTGSERSCPVRGAISTAWRFRRDVDGTAQR